MRTYGINMVNPIRQGEIKYSSPLQDEEWSLLETKAAQQDQMRLPISPLEELLKTKQDEHEFDAKISKIKQDILEEQMRMDDFFGKLVRDNMNIPKQLPIEPISITYDKDGNAEITIQI